MAPVVLVVVVDVLGGGRVPAAAVHVGRCHPVPAVGHGRVPLVVVSAVLLLLGVVPVGLVAVGKARSQSGSRKNEKSKRDTH